MHADRMMEKQDEPFWSTVLGQQGITCPACNRFLPRRTNPDNGSRRAIFTIEPHMRDEHRLKVYGFTGWRRRERGPNPSFSGQTREVIATRTVAGVMRASGRTRSDLNNFGSWTGNIEEVMVALSKPGVVLWRPLDRREPGGWQEDTKDA